MRRKRARMGGFDDGMFFRIDKRKFADGEISPKNENEMVAVVGQFFDSSVRKGFPSFSPMRSGES